MFRFCGSFGPEALWWLISLPLRRAHCLGSVNAYEAYSPGLLQEDRVAVDHALHHICRRRGPHGGGGGGRPRHGSCGEELYEHGLTRDWGSEAAGKPDVWQTSRLRRQRSETTEK